MLGYRVERDDRDTSDYSLDSLAGFLERAKRRYVLSTEPASPEYVPSFAKRVSATPDAAVTRADADLDKAWHEAERVFQQGTAVKGIVAGWNRGGLLVRWDRLQGFVPTSQLREIPVFDEEDVRDEQLARWVGEELDLRVIELDKSRNRLVLSERATAWGPKEGERLLQQVTPGEVRAGSVSNICDFGAFVDLGGVDGLIHISELSWGRVTHPGEQLKIGQKVSVYVLSVDRDNGRIALSVKRLAPNPWATVDENYSIGQTVEATVTNVVDFGAFARLEEGLEGLIHISEISREPLGHPREAVQPGQSVTVRILRIESKEHRLGLSMAQVDDVSEPIDFPESAEVDSSWHVRPTLLY